MLITPQPSPDSDPDPDPDPDRTQAQSSPESQPQDHLDLGITVQVGDWLIENQAGATSSELERIAVVLDRAKEVWERATPIYSGFKAGVALDVGEGRVAAGANNEYSLGQSIHAEEAAVSAAISEFGSNLQLDLWAAVCDTPGPVTDCGNCLDLLSKYSLPETIGVGGCFGQVARAVRFRDLVPELTTQISQSELSAQDLRLIENALENKYRGLKIIPSDKIPRGGAAISVEMSDGSVIIPRAGVRHETASYHSATEIHQALATAPALDGVANSLAVATENGKIWCRDRQLIFEAGEILLSLGKGPLKILVHRADENSVYVSDHRELAPFGFGVRQLGLEAEVADHYRRMRGRE